MYFDDSDSTLKSRPGKLPLRVRVKKVVSEMKQTFKARGFKGLFQVYGWKLVIGIFFYYLIRDLTLYVLIPWLVLRKMLETNPF